MERKTDQRVRLTQTLLKNALVQLMQEQHISKISVRALCDTAGINRSTFYTHYTDPHDLLNKVEQDVLKNVSRHLEKQDLNYINPLPVQVLTGILEYFKENADLFKALLSENCDFAFQKDIMGLARVISSQITLNLAPKTREYIKAFSLTGAISMLHTWLQDDMREPADEMAAFIIRILYFGITGLDESKRMK